MFGLNDNNSQTADNSNPAPAGEPPAMPANPFGDNDAPVPPPAAPAEAAPTLPPPPQDTTAAPTTDVAPAPAPPTGGDLLDLKQEALQSLQPLVSHLEQSPEEKFKTTMMLIQATDNSALVKQAYEAANQITDEKARAQALLDVVNEINYFTHKNGEAGPKPN